MGRTMTTDGAVEQSIDPLASAEAAAQMQRRVALFIGDGRKARLALDQP